MNKDWRCRIGWHKFAIRRNAESGATPMVYWECRRCTKQKDIAGTPGGGLGGAGMSSGGGF